MTAPVRFQRRRSRSALTAFAISAILGFTSVARGDLITFETLPPVTGTQFNGADAAGRYYDREIPVEYTAVDKFGDQINVRTFTEGGVTFLNKEKYDGGYWEGFASSDVIDRTTEGYTNQYAAYVPPAAGPDRNTYGVAFGYYDTISTPFDPSPFDPSSVADLRSLSTFVLPVGTAVLGMNVANTTYAALSMMNGDGFAKAFGGITGDDADWFKLTAYGIGSDGMAMAESVEFYLADYRFSDNSLDYIIDDWTWMDLSSLAGAESLHFNLSSSDSGDYGLNTPGYFAIDDLQTQAVPEPTSLLLASLTGAGVLVGRFRRRRLTEEPKVKA